VVSPDAAARYDSLGPTIERYNGLVTEAHQLDAKRLVQLRDALAHGRVFPTGTTGYPMRLVKFGRKTSAGVPIETAVDMTAAWFAEQIELVGAAIHRTTGA
jgi:hypothetical protein